jgi:hypothetical protein
MGHSIQKKSFMAHYPTACHFNTTVDLLDVWSPFEPRGRRLMQGSLGECVHFRALVRAMGVDISERFLGIHTGCRGN